MNLISEQPGKTPGYWCTWGLQNTLAASQDTSNSFGFTGHSLIAKTLTEENMLKHSFETNFLVNIRGDLFVLYDLGWDVPGDVSFDGNNWMLGSLEVATDKFPSASGTPTERLFKLNEWTKSYGWRGAALWVSANAYGDGKDDIRFSDENLENYFRERMKWSAEAGIEYWKVDYGLRALDHKFREMLTRIGREVAPNLLIEHARNGGPLNDVECPWDTPNVKGTGLFKAWDEGLIYQASVDMVQFSDVFRTYDVSRTLSVPTTLDRVSEMLQAFSETGNTCILNCESEPLIGSVLGCAIGIMGHHQEEGEAQLTDNSHADEYVRAIKWQRMAPAWGVGYGKNYSDTEYLADM
ncbi:MAG: hypothetical protein H7X86_10500 [Gorillibacterium sp.]|nr:hypothetical protein [Gorillibacterium sp.]